MISIHLCLASQVLTAVLFDRPQLWSILYYSIHMDADILGIVAT
jgi:hypothetical protein